MSTPWRLDRYHINSADENLISLPFALKIYEIEELALLHKFPSHFD